MVRTCFYTMTPDLHFIVDTLPILYLSRYIIQLKADYYRLLLQVTREDIWGEV